MRNQENKATLLPVGETYLTKYLETEPVRPLMAYALGISARVKFMQDDKEGAGKLREKADALDPFYSKASGVPSMSLFSKPFESKLYHNYWMRPF